MRSAGRGRRAGAMSREATISRLMEEMLRRHRAEPHDVRVVFSPYRICPLGAHIDHQLGAVTAMAIDRGVVLAYAPLPSREVRLSSLDFPGEVSFSLDDVPDRQPDDWGNFPRGAVRALAAKYTVRRGIAGVTAGRLGEGGLSSSAAAGVAYLLALEDASGLDVSPRENILLDQAIENGYLGLRNGVLDQSAILLSRKDHLTRIDCATLDHEIIPRAAAMADFRILVAFSGIRRPLVSTDYNLRVGECAEAARRLLEAAGRRIESPLLGHVRREEYEAHRGVLDGALARRAAHFFSESERVEKGVLAWREGRLEEFGDLMTASGESSIASYECGSPPLIDLHHILRRTEGVYGARFSGAGFRGCCVALVDPEAAQQTAEDVRRAYADGHPDLAADAPVFVYASGDGARILESS